MFLFYDRHEFLTLEHPQIIDDLSKAGLDDYVIPLREEVVLEVADFNGNLRDIKRFVDRRILRCILPGDYNVDAHVLPQECVLKNNTSMFSDGVKIVNRLTAQNDLAQIAKKYGIEPCLMVEQKIPGRQYEISGWINPNGIYFLDTLEQEWTGNRIKSYRPASPMVTQCLKKMIRIIDKELDLPYTGFCIEARFVDNVPKVIDFNLRLGEERPGKGYHDMDTINLQMIKSFNEATVEARPA